MRQAWINIRLHPGKAYEADTVSALVEKTQAPNMSGSSKKMVIELEPLPHPCSSQAPLGRG